MKFEGAKERSLMETRLEVDRLRQVYTEYANRGLARSKWSAANRGNQAIQQEWRRCLREVLANYGLIPLANKRILDLGCGTGEILAGFEEWGAQPENLIGVDLLAERIQAAAKRFPAIKFQQVNAEALPFENRSFELVSLFTVLTSILDLRMIMNVAQEIDRVLTPGGAVIWYDLRISNPFNRQVRGMSRRRIEQLFPGFGLCLQPLTLVPPLARRLGKLTPTLYPLLASLPWLKTHYLGLLTKPGGRP
jgi:SAM-dependent methyltransferase